MVTNTKTNFNMIFKQDDEINIDYVSGNSITTTDSKFGQITYFYDNNTKMWMKTDDQEGENITPNLTPVKAIPEFYTKNGLPVFRGTGRWLTYVVPLSHTTFLKLNITGSGQTQPLTELVKTIDAL